MRTKIVLLIIFIFISVFLMEIAIRLIRPLNYLSFFSHSSKETKQCDSAELPTIIRSSGIVGYELIPRKGKGMFKVNKLGLMDKERIPEKTKDVFRIIALGDSLTGGRGTWVDLLESMLNNKAGNKLKYEVWNAGVPAYGTIQECAWLRSKGLNYTPDLVIIGFCLNDFEVTPLLLREDKKMVIYWPQREVRRCLNPVLLKYSHLYRHIVNIFVFKNNIIRQESIYNHVRLSLKQVKDLLAKKNINLLVVVFPYFKDYGEYDSGERQNYAAIQNILNELDVRHMDLSEGYNKGKYPIEKLHIGDKLHPNSRGHYLAARMILRFLVVNKLTVY